MVEYFLTMSDIFVIVYIRLKVYVHKPLTEKRCKSDKPAMAAIEEVFEIGRQQY